MRLTRLLATLVAVLGIAAPCAAQMSYDGGMVVRHNPRVVMVVWGKQWSSDPVHEVRTLTRFYSGLGTGADRWSQILEQYGVPYPHHVLARRIWDESTPAPAAPTISQVAAEATRIAVRIHAGASTLVVVLTPHGVVPQGFPDQFCGSHSVADTGTPYVVLPYVADASAECGGQGGVTVVASHEYAEALTDSDTLGWSGAGFEIADLCELNGPAVLETATGTYAVAQLWSNAAQGCVGQVPVGLSGRRPHAATPR